MESFHCALLPHTRLRRSTIKRVFVSFLSPICQLQQVVISIAFNIWHNNLKEFAEEIETKYKWTVGYGVLLSAGILIISIIIIYAFNRKDLRLWQYSESLLKEFTNINLWQND